MNHRKKTNKSLKAYMDMYSDIEQSTLNNIEQNFGLSFSNNINSKVDYLERVYSLKENGAIVRNHNKSVVSNEKLSSACEACQTGAGSYTTFISLKCHRDCYFCFNKNQDDYHFYVNNRKNTKKELLDLINQGVTFTHLALTGGEPLLYPEETVEFFKLAQELTPESHTRLYTSGDLLNSDLLHQLELASLDEIRFSIKLEDSPQKQNHILKQIELANHFIPTVIVEMPVIPGEGEAMKELLIQLNQLGIFGINLLEFCFPFKNAHKFNENGLMLKNPPYDVYYNFWYAGGVAVAESERLCLDLVDFAIKENLGLGVHYCSLENKFTGQIYQQNYDQTIDQTYLFSKEDYYFKTAKVFGADQTQIKPILQENKIPFIINEEYDFLQFSLQALDLVRKIDVEILISSNVVENDQQGKYIREVHVELLNPQQLLHS